ncbi:hypothetical protein [Nitrosospira sp. Nsp13]|uniref:hypothetical protein n=1 Tax=Nitrosospira sp. Nsp13 TaxID=1855332 RepID=UPI00087F2E9B|nr:hypothetical protein [Nitrosospira sp. Nsp13]SCY57982.1 hypothetical protein SAMN05216308_12012 [Nitrosospira sp. Nsp13]
MNKLISTIILGTLTAVCSFGAAAGSDGSDKKKETMRKDNSENTSKKSGDKYGGTSGSVSDKDSETMREKSLSEREREYKDQEVMNKKPYKQ